MRQKARPDLLTRADPTTAVSVRQNLLTPLWRTDVEALEASIGGLNRTPASNECQVVFFEIEGDADLHVNVTHKYLTNAVKGWSGPGRVTDGFVHNRRFSGAEPRKIMR